MKMYGRNGKDVVEVLSENGNEPQQLDRGCFLRTEMPQPLKGDDGNWLPERKYVVSTTFLPVDHNFKEEGDPVVFETMVFEIKGRVINFSELYCKRFSDYNQAVYNHMELIGEINAGRLTFEERPDV